MACSEVLIIFACGKQIQTLELQEQTAVMKETTRTLIRLQPLFRELFANTVRLHLALLLALPLLVLAGCTTGAGRRAVWQSVLDRAQQQNLAFDSITNLDSIQMAVDFYDRNGTANERMRANYLLGCAFRDMGDAPRAVECYQMAVEHADTLSRQCDFYRLSCAYSQMAEAYHKQLLLQNELEARKKAGYYAMRSDSIFFAIYEMDLSSANYILQGKNDSAKILLEQVRKLYQQYGYEKYKLLSSRTLIYLYTREPERLKDAKQLIDSFDAKSCLLDIKSETSPSVKLYYYYKGLYFDKIGLLDSAEFYYRKSFRIGMPISDQDPTYRGLFSVFSQRHQADSIEKYARLFCEANDSSIAKKDRELMAQTTASYNYRQYQKKAFEEEKKVQRTFFFFFGFVVFVLFLALFFGQYFKRYKAAKNSEMLSLKKEYTNATCEYQKNLQMLQMLEESNRAVIETVKKELNSEQAKSQSYYEELSIATSHLNTFKQDYEFSKKELLEENALLEAKIRKLKKQNRVLLGDAQENNFFETDIVKRIRFLQRNPLLPLSNEEKEQLLITAEKYYPDLLSDLCYAPSIKKQESLVCILVVLNLRGTECANLLQVSTQRITNIKILLNSELFAEDSARSLYKNLIQKYDILPL